METSSEKNSLKKGPWTPDEDRKLVDCIQKHGHGNWKEISKLAGLNRCGKSCRLRWANYLRPDIKRGAFSDEEEKLIIELHAKLGNKWSAIASYLPGRTDNEIKNFWNTHIKKRLLRNGIDPFTHMPRNNPSSFLPVLPQFLGCTSLRSPTWENVVRFQTDAARLAKILLIGNILQAWNTGTSPHLPMEAFNLSSEPAQVTSRPPCDSRLMGLPLEGLTPKPEYNTFTCQPGLSSVPQPVFQNTTETNSFTEVYSSGIGGSSTVYTDYTVPDLVPASPECLNTDKKQNNIIIPTNVSNPSSTSTTFEALEDLMDDEANNYYWEQILDQASLSPGSISFLQEGCEWSIARD